MMPLLVSTWRIALGLALAIVAYSIATGLTELSHQAGLVAGITALCATWWITEAIPIPVTSLIPLTLLPLLSILTPNQVAEAYGNPLILLLMGGCILSTAMERSGTHEKVALQMVHLFGSGSARSLVVGFMVTSALLSMWISNTATTLMLLPVALAVLSASGNTTLTPPLLLGICYSASIGGMATPIGTPPNLILMSIYEENTGKSISFIQWMSWCLPVVLILVPAAAMLLTRRLGKINAIDLPTKSPWTIEQKRVMIVFALTALAWITRSEPFGGWRALMGVPSANDASVALIAVVMMFLVPNGKGGKLLDWESAAKIPWGMLLLFSGGIALAKGFVVTGLAEYLAAGLAQLSILPVFIMMLCICLGVTFLTEVTSNTASTSLLMPVLVIAGLSMNIDPLLMMMPAALSASCAFMLPVATAPNAIIFGSGRVTISQMVRHGIVLNFLGAVIVSIMLSVILSE